MNNNIIEPASPRVLKQSGSQSQPAGRNGVDVSSATTAGYPLVSGTFMAQSLFLDFVLVTAGALLLALLAIGGNTESSLQDVSTQGIGGMLSFWLILLRLVLGILYIVIVPGYCIMCALFPAVGDLSGTQRAGISIGLSIALVPAIAVFLDNTPFSVRPLPIVISELVVCAACALFTIGRRFQLHKRDVLYWMPGAIWTHMPRRLSYSLALGIVAISILAAISPVGAAQNQHTTEFYLLGPTGVVADYPSNLTLLTAGQTASTSATKEIEVYIANHERAQRTYSIETQLQPSDATGEKIVLSTVRGITVPEGGTQEVPLKWDGQLQSPDTIVQAGASFVDIVLYADGDTTPYRELRLPVQIDAQGATK